MGKVNFVELATYCTNRAKEARSAWGGKYERTHYVCILEDNTVKYSMTPHVLRDAYQCILMHERSEIPIWGMALVLHHSRAKILPLLLS